MSYTITKRYEDFPFAHRQHTHGGHCAFVHGHNWGFVFVFGAQERDNNGFVVDFGSLGWLKEWLTEYFDHTLCLAVGDPLRQRFGTELQRPDGLLPGFAKLVVLSDVSAEGLAEFVYRTVSARLLRQYAPRRVWLVSVTVEEDRKNSATFDGYEND